MQASRDRNCCLHRPPWVKVSTKQVLSPAQHTWGGEGKATGAPLPCGAPHRVSVGLITPFPLLETILPARGPLRVP